MDKRLASIGILVVFLCFFGAIGVSAMRFSETIVRKKILSHTPLGSDMDLVMDFCRSRRLDCSRSESAGYWDNKKNIGVGKKSIHAATDEMKIGIVTLTMATEWGFDKDGKLIDVFVWRTIDAI